MKPVFEPMPTAERWQVSNAPVLSMAACLASLDIFDTTTMSDLSQKSKQLTTFLEETLEFINDTFGKKIFNIITPENRGSQLSIVCNVDQPKNLFQSLINNGVIADWREPNVIRLAPVPLYNSFEDIYNLALVLQNILPNYV